MNNTFPLPNYHHGEAIPQALGAALMEADASLAKFSRLSEEEKREFIGGAENLHTGYELRSYVQSFLRGNGEDYR